MKYTVITSYGVEHLIKDVNTHLANGWELLGPMSMCHDGDEGGMVIFAQTMTMPYQHAHTVDVRDICK